MRDLSINKVALNKTDGGNGLRKNEMGDCTKDAVRERSQSSTLSGDAAKTAASKTTSRRMIQSNSESKSQSRSTSQSQSLSQKSQSQSQRQSQNQSYSESRSGIVDDKMRAAEQRMIWKSGQKMTQIVSVIVPVTADCEKAGDALRAAEDCGKAGDALRGAEDLREDLRGLNAGRKRPATNDDEEADIQRRQLDLTSLTHFYMRDLGDRGLWPDRRSGGCDVKCLARSSSRSRIERLGKRI